MFAVKETALAVLEDFKETLSREREEEARALTHRGRGSLGHAVV